MDYIKMAKEYRATMDAIVKVNRKFLKESELTLEEMLEFKEAYEPWTPELNRFLEVGEYFKYKGELYKVAIGHPHQADYTPDASPALFRAIHPEDVIPIWIEPTDGTVSYHIGSKVTHNGVVWVSDMDGNNTEPGDDELNRYWKPDIEDIEPEPEESEEPEQVEDWVQPDNDENKSYSIGDRVKYNDIIWVSHMDGNNTIPDEDEPHNRYWKPEQ